MERLRLIILCLTAACALGTGSAHGGSATLNCSVEHIAVTAGNIEDARLACETAATADRRLRQLGLALVREIRIEVTQDLDVAPGTCVALYSTAERKLQVLPRDCLDDQPGRAKAFPEMKADLLFESLVIHELVHAYVDQAAQTLFLQRVAHEYLAYAIQLDMLPDEERRRILAKAGVEEPVDLSALNEAVLNLLPLKFAAMAWLHFNREGRDAAVVARVLDGSLAFHSLRE